VTSSADDSQAESLIGAVVVDGVPRDVAAERCCSVADLTINDGTAAASMVTHPRLPHSEQTSVEPSETTAEAAKWICAVSTPRSNEVPVRETKMRTLTSMCRGSSIGGFVIACVLAAGASILAPPASAVPGPEVEYTYNVIVRRHFDFPNNDAIGYGFGICDKVTRGASYADVMGDVKRDVFPSDEQSANYVVSYAVGILCPAQIWQLRNSAAGYRPPLG
jgi:hypothetical protein